MDNAQARIILRPIGSPLTIGMSGLAVASLVQSGLDLSWISRSDTVDVGLILLAVPFTLQLLSSIFSYLARDGAVGATTGVLATSWLGLGLVQLVTPSRPAIGALGLMLLAAGGITGMSASAVALGKPLPGAVFLIAAARLALAGIYQLSGVSFWQSSAGIAGLVVTAGAAYCLLAFELEGQRHRPVLPTMRRGMARLALRDGAEAQLEGVANEAGVRQTS